VRCCIHREIPDEVVAKPGDLLFLNRTAKEAEYSRDRTNA
jgi:hypothetical protein